MHKPRILTDILMDSLNKQSPTRFIRRTDSIYKSADVNRLFSKFMLTTAEKGRIICVDHLK